jgi:hypothetical protein
MPAVWSLLSHSCYTAGAAIRIHIKNIVVFFHPMSGMQFASCKFSTATGENVTRLESEVSFLQVKATKERICQVKAEMCDNRRQITCICPTGESGRHREPLQHDAGVLKRTSDHTEWSHGVRQEVSGD